MTRWRQCVGKMWLTNPWYTIPWTFLRETCPCLLFHTLSVPCSDWQLIPLCIDGVAVTPTGKTPAAPLSCFYEVFPFRAQRGVTAADHCKGSCPVTKLQQLSLQHEQGYWVPRLHKNLLQKGLKTPGCTYTSEVLWNHCFLNHYTSSTVHKVPAMINFFPKNIFELSSLPMACVVSVWVWKVNVMTQSTVSLFHFISLVCSRSPEMGRGLCSVSCGYLPVS